MRKAAIIVAILLLLSFLFAGERELKIERSFPTKGERIELDVGVVTGNLKVLTWDKNEIRVEGVITYREKEPKVEIEYSHGYFRLKVEKKKDCWWFFCGDWGREKIWADLTLMVPEPFEGKVSVVNGKLEVKSILGKRNGYVRVSSVNGIVRVIELKGEEVKVSTVNGRIMLSGVRADELKLSTVNGRVSATGIFARRLKASSVNGDIELELEGEETVKREGYWKISTVNGDIIVNFLHPPALHYDFRLKSVGGGIYVDLPGAAIESSRGLFRQSFEINPQASPSIYVDISTVSGSIEVRSEKEGGKGNR